MPGDDSRMVRSMGAEVSWKPLARRLALGDWERLRLRAYAPPTPEEGAVRRLGLYLHVPFCPYHRVELDPHAYRRFERAVMQEIDLYAKRLQRCDIVSLYVGGGTPTVDLDGLCRLLEHLRSSFPIRHSVLRRDTSSRRDGRRARSSHPLWRPGPRPLR